MYKQFHCAFMLGAGRIAKASLCGTVCPNVLSIISDDKVELSVQPHGKWSRN